MDAEAQVDEAEAQGGVRGAADEAGDAVLAGNAISRVGLKLRCGVAATSGTASDRSTLADFWLSVLIGRARG